MIVDHYLIEISVTFPDGAKLQRSAYVAKDAPDLMAALRQATKAELARLDAQVERRVGRS